jgi:hypothetical protein
LLSNGDRARVLLATGIVGVCTLVAGVAARQTVAVTVGVVFLSGAYAAHLIVDDPALDARAVLMAAGLLLTAELGCWSIELRSELTREPGRHLRRLVAEIALCLGGLAVSALVLAAADLGRLGGIGIELAGAAAAVALAWLAAELLRPRV